MFMFIFLLRHLHGFLSLTGQYLDGYQLKSVWHALSVGTGIERLPLPSLSLPPNLEVGGQLEGGIYCHVETTVGGVVSFIATFLIN